MTEDKPMRETTVGDKEPGNDADGELQAIHAIIEALKPLAEQERRRTLEYVLGRFGLLPAQPLNSLSAQHATVPAQLPTQAASYVQDIRTLKELKTPKSAIEMAALVAYYVSELAPTGERNRQINKADLERYFKMAGFRLPADAGFTLVNAKNAGYLDNAGGGQYTLNPVGYNLVVHRMGQEEGGKKGARRAGAKNATKKATPRRKK
jgi:hypothetical protein